MATFYDNWLGMWDKAETERKEARKVIHEEEIEWVETQQDAKTGLLAAPETGFRTWGTTTMLAEIEPGKHTGKHKHGEEAIHIVEGSGCTVVNDKRYNWDKNSTLVIPFGAEHQHFNTGDTTVRYFSAMAPHLEFFAGVARFTQLENWGKTDRIPSVPLSADGFDDTGRRICMTIEQAVWSTAGEGGGRNSAPRLSQEELAVLKDMEDKPIVLGTQAGYQNVRLPTGGHHAPGPSFMSIRQQSNGFKAKEVEISSIMRDYAHTASGVHAHMEAFLYMLEGEGYALIEDSTKVTWKKGSLVHVQGPQTKHQHFNESDGFSEMLRIAPGFRYFFEDVAHEEFPYLYYSVRPELLRQLQMERERSR